MVITYDKKVCQRNFGLRKRFDMNFEGIKKVLTYIKNNFIDSDSNMYSLVGIILL